VLDEADNWTAWERWQAGLTIKPTLCEKLPPLRLLLVMDNLKGDLTASFVVWLFEHGVMPLLNVKQNFPWMSIRTAALRRRAEVGEQGWWAMERDSRRSG
jgi:hypothetical protein